MAGQTAEEALFGLLVVSIIFMVLNTIFVVLRLISRFSLKQTNVGLDDVLVILGYIFNMALCGESLVIRNYLMIGNPPANEPVMNLSILEPALKAIYANEQLLYASFSLPKLSILFLYLRVFEGNWFKKTTWVLIAITAICWVVFAFIAAFLCSPVSYYWDRTIPGGHCINNDSFWRAIPPFNMFTDIGALLVPIPIIWRLEASAQKKLGIIAIFLTGGIGLVTCCIRWGVYLTHSVATLGPFNAAPMLTWAIVEGGVYEIAACLPVMRPVVMALTPRSLRAKWGSWKGASTRGATPGPEELGVGRNDTVSRKDRRKYFSRLDDNDSTEGRLGLVDAEKGGETESRVARVPSREEIEMGAMPGDGIRRTVEVEVSESTSGR